MLVREQSGPAPAQPLPRSLHRRLDERWQSTKAAEVLPERTEHGAVVDDVHAMGSDELVERGVGEEAQVRVVEYPGVLVLPDPDEQPQPGPPVGDVGNADHDGAIAAAPLDRLGQARAGLAEVLQDVGADYDVEAVVFERNVLALDRGVHHEVGRLTGHGAGRRRHVDAGEEGRPVPELAKQVPGAAPDVEQAAAIRETGLHRCRDLRRHGLVVQVDLRLVDVVQQRLFSRQAAGGGRRSPYL
jgi:hypothetical protein